MKTFKQNDYFKTTDISLASTAYHFGGKIEDIDKTNPSRVIFVFKRTKELDALIQGFWAHSLLVEPLAFFNSLKELKTRIYQRVE